MIVDVHHHLWNTAKVMVVTGIIALTALAALGLSGDPVHEPVHARGPCAQSSCYCA